MPDPQCQHCGQPVRFDTTEHGYRGFVHEESGLAACLVLYPLGRAEVTY